MKGTIFNIQRFSTDDGPGIRTTVFLKGCPLRCAWCHNPESQELKAELFYASEKCIACGECISVCKTGAHTLRDGKHYFQRNLCTRCGACAKVCYANALENCGYETDAESIVSALKRDEPFFRHSGGGLTVSGGEPLFQAPFTEELCRLTKRAQIHTCVETSGFGRTDALATLSEFVDLFLFDYKISDEKSANKWLGVPDISLIRRNLAELNKQGANIVLRCPIIPTANFTDAHFKSIVRLVQETESVREVHLLPYHPLGIEKSKRLGKQASFNDQNFLNAELLQNYAKQIATETNRKTTVR